LGALPISSSDGWLWSTTLRAVATVAIESVGAVEAAELQEGEGVVLLEVLLRHLAVAKAQIAISRVSARFPVGGTPGRHPLHLDREAPMAMSEPPRWAARPWCDSWCDYDRSGQLPFGGTIEHASPPSPPSDHRWRFLRARA
jgi:hypothetical protein